MKAASQHTKAGAMRTIIAPSSCFTRAKCFQKLCKVELFRKRVSGIFLCQASMKEIFHAVWEARSFSTATAKTGTEPVKNMFNNLGTTSFYLCSIGYKLAWSSTASSLSTIHIKYCRSQMSQTWAFPHFTSYFNSGGQLTDY